MEIDFNKARSEAFIVLKERDNVSILDSKEKQRLNIDDAFEVWEVRTEILGFKNIGLEITFYIRLDTDFPLSLPKIYLSQEDYEKLKFIPHIDSNKLVCTFDSEKTRTDPHNPSGIILECLKKAKDIISDGLNGINESHFEDEFIAYWECKYGNNDDVKKDMLSLIDTDTFSNNISLIILEKVTSTFKYILHNNDDIAIRFIEFLNTFKLKYLSVDAFYIGKLTMSKPPFELFNKTIIEIINNQDSIRLKEFEKFLNKSNNVIFVAGLVQADKNLHLVGWFHKELQIKRSGFRKGALKNFEIFKTFQRNDRVIRVSPVTYTPKRVQTRTNGLFEKKELKILIAGLGSIGSNLYLYLDSIGVTEYKFIDPDILTLENINRHFLGFDYIGMNKARAMELHVKSNDPLQNILTKPESIITTCITNIDFINNSDFIFIAIGKANIELWLTKNIESKKIIKPMFILWVEPYLAGGHCLFLNTFSCDYSKYFDSDGLFIYNIISKDAYSKQHEILKLRESGCQTTYTPYSSNNIIGFLSALFPMINSIISETPTKSLALSWIGNIKQLNDLGIKLSKFAEEQKSWSLIQHEL